MILKKISLFLLILNVGLIYSAKNRVFYNSSGWCHFIQEYKDTARTKERVGLQKSKHNKNQRDQVFDRLQVGIALAIPSFLIGAGLYLYTINELEKVK